MKFPIAGYVVLLLALAGLGWHDRGRLVRLRADHQKLVMRASLMGIAPDPDQNRESLPITKRPRQDRGSLAKEAAADFILYAKEMSALGGKLGMPLDTATRMRMADQIDRMMALDGSQLKVVIREVAESRDIDEHTRANLVDFCIKQLAKDHPQQALTLLTDPPELLERIHRTTNGQAENLIHVVVQEFAKKNPQAAIGWFRENLDVTPDYLIGPVKEGLISGTGSGDPRLALKFIGDLGLDADTYAPRIGNGSKTPEQRSVALAAYREWRDAEPDDRTRAAIVEKAIRGLAFSSGHGPNDFDHVTRWIDETNCSSREIESITEDLKYFVKLQERGKWVEWLGEKLPADIARERIRPLVSTWSEKSYEAVENWLESTAESPAKHSAACAYAETVFARDPESAIRWTLSVPEGEERDRTLKLLHDQWPEDDPTGAEAFATELGID